MQNIYLVRSQTRMHFATMLCSLFCAASVAIAEPIAWRHDITAAVAEAEKTQKPLLLKVSTSWCHYCVKMDVETYPDPELAARIRAGFIPVSIDGDAHQQLTEQLGVQTFPTVVITDHQLQPLRTLVGFQSESQLIGELTSLAWNPPAAAPKRRVKPTLTKMVGRIRAESDQGAAGRERSSRRLPDQARPDQDRPDQNQLSKVEPIQSLFGNNCPVSPFLSGELLPGDPQLQLVHRGFAVQFSSQEALDEFVSGPNQYWPIADGRCVVSLVDDRGDRRGHLNLGLVYANRVWLFSSAEYLERFRARPQVYLRLLVELSKQHRRKRT